MAQIFVAFSEKLNFIIDFRLKYSVFSKELFNTNRKAAIKVPAEFSKKYMAMHRHLVFSHRNSVEPSPQNLNVSYHAHWFSLTKVLKIIDLLSSSAGLLTNTQILLLNAIPRGLSMQDYTKTHRKTPGNPSKLNYKRYENYGNTCYGA